jgi:hypothetical protein
MRELTALMVVVAVRAAAAQSVDTFELRTALFEQFGHGFQSRAGDPGMAGSERTTIWEPLFRLTVRDGAWTHDATVTVDIVSAASPDALDAITTASAVNEAATLDVTTTYQADGDDRLSIRYGAHIEEPFRSVFIGFGWARDLAEKNATVSLSALVMGDVFDDIDFNGYRHDETTRATMTFNAAASQILGPTTLVDASYGLTYQRGTIENTWNSVPLGDDSRGPEIFPGPRLRHALSARIAQHIPDTHSTVKASYRFYIDNYGLDAHTAEVLAYQYLVPWLYLRGSYRYYWQSGVDFYGQMFGPGTTPRTADSDLAPFHAHEWGVKLVMLAEQSPFDFLRRSSIDASFFRYVRSNDLTVSMFALSFGMRF